MFYRQWETNDSSKPALSCRALCWTALSMGASHLDHFNGRTQNTRLQIRRQYSNMMSYKIKHHVNSILVTGYWLNPYLLFYFIVTYLEILKKYIQIILSQCKGISKTILVMWTKDSRRSRYSTKASGREHARISSIWNRSSEKLKKDKIKDGNFGTLRKNVTCQDFIWDFIEL